jgi:hypothetical protein
MRARYLGNLDNFAAFGIHFPRGVFVEVSDTHAQSKIRNNNHYEVEREDIEDVEFTETVTPAPQDEAPAQTPEAVHEVGDAQPVVEEPAAQEEEKRGPGRPKKK